MTAQMRKRREVTCMIVVRRGERTRPDVRVTVSFDTGALRRIGSK